MGPDVVVLFIPGARRFVEMGIATKKPVPEPDQIERGPREVAAGIVENNPVEPTGDGADAVETARPDDRLTPH